MASNDYKKVTTHALLEMKQRGEKISMLTAYDYSFRTDYRRRQHIDVILGGRLSQ